MLFPFVIQENNNDCALACFAMIYQFYFKQQLELNDLKQVCDLTENEGINLLKLKQLAKRYALKFEIYHADFQQLKHLKVNNPVIIQILNDNLDYHFIVIYKKKKDYILVADPKENSLIWYKIDDFNNNFTGIIVDCQKQENVKTSKSKINKFNPFLIPKYFIYASSILINNLILVLMFFITQVFYKTFINQIVINNNFQIALVLLITFFIINVIHLLINFMLDKLAKTFYYYFISFLINNFYQKWFSLRPATVKNFNNSYYLQTYQDINSITSVFTNNILELIINFITMTIVSFILIKISYLVWIVTVVSGIINLFFNFIVMKNQKPLMKKSINQKMQVQNAIINTNQNFEDSYFRNLLFYLKNNLNDKTSQTLVTDYALDKNKINNATSTTFIKHFLNFISMYLLLTLIFNHNLAFSQLIFISSINIYVLNFFYHLGSFCYFWPEFQRSYHRFNSFLNLPTKNSMTQVNDFQVSSFKEIKLIACNFEINNKIIFKDLNLSLSGHTLLIGNNGIGKTSLLSLLNLKYQNFQGLITINDHNINDFNLDLWEQECVYLSSNSNVMLGTILENLLSFEITEEKLKILKQLEIEKLLLQFGLKLTDYCLTYSKNLSQGQKQIIIFLSLFFNNWKIILLDEILSNINYDFKIYLIKMLLQYFPKAIIIYVSHDLLLENLFTNIVNLNQINKGY